MALDSKHGVTFQLHRAERAEAPVACVSPSTTGNLRKLGWVQGAAVTTVELAQRSKGHVIDVHVQAHADGVGRHHEAHLAGLVHGHLGVSRPRRKRAEHHRCPPAASTQLFGQLVDLCGRESDHGRARWQR